MTRLIGYVSKGRTSGPAGPAWTLWEGGSENHEPGSTLAHHGGPVAYTAKRPLAVWRLDLTELHVGAVLAGLTTPHGLCERLEERISRVEATKLTVAVQPPMMLQRLIQPSAVRWFDHTDMRVQVEVVGPGTPPGLCGRVTEGITRVEWH